MERWNGGMNFFSRSFCLLEKYYQEYITYYLLSGVHSARAEECTIPCISSRKNWLGRVA